MGTISGPPSNISQNQFSSFLGAAALAAACLGWAAGAGVPSCVARFSIACLLEGAGPSCARMGIAAQPRIAATDRAIRQGRVGETDKPRMRFLGPSCDFPTGEQRHFKAG